MCDEVKYRTRSRSWRPASSASDGLRLQLGLPLVLTSLEGQKAELTHRLQCCYIEWVLLVMKHYLWTWFYLGISYGMKFCVVMRDAVKTKHWTCIVVLRSNSDLEIFQPSCQSSAASKWPTLCWEGFTQWRQRMCLEYAAWHITSHLCFTLELSLSVLYILLRHPFICLSAWHWLDRPPTWFSDFLAQCCLFTYDFTVFVTCYIVGQADRQVFLHKLHILLQFMYYYYYYCCEVLDVCSGAEGAFGTLWMKQDQGLACRQFDQTRWKIDEDSSRRWTNTKTNFVQPRIDVLRPHRLCRCHGDTRLLACASTCWTFHVQLTPAKSHGCQSVVLTCHARPLKPRSTRWSKDVVSWWCLEVFEVMPETSSVVALHCSLRLCRVMSTSSHLHQNTFSEFKHY